ncbi:MAG: hypothetical protein ACXVQ6_12675, partial [Actinomycetota bacterium]
VEFEQDGKVVATTRTAPDTQWFHIRLASGRYVMVVIIQGGCPQQVLHVRGSKMTLKVICNLIA